MLGKAGRVFGVVLCSAGLLGCGARGGDQDGASGGINEVGGNDAETEAEGGGDGGEKFDIGGGEEADGGDGAGEGGGEEACKNVDVILAVDNSGSMQEEIDALRGPVFDSLPQQLLDVGNGIDDFQLAVIDACPKPAHFHDHGEGGACGFSTGTNYMSSNSPNLAGEFACVTNLSNTGYQGMPDQCEDEGANKDDDEQPALTASTAVTPANLAGANSGFVRDEAVLFVVAITDEDEEFLGTNANLIAQSLIDAKGGSIDNVVFLGVAGASDCNGPYGSADSAPNMQSVVAQFEAAERGVFWDLCGGDLEGAFAAGIDVLDSACEEFVPPG